MTLSKKPVAKKRGRPLGSKNKTSLSKVRAWEKKNLLNENNAVWDKIEQMSFEIEDLKHKEIGYRAVISYLQARLDGNAEL
jgi:hypothetical protein